MIGVQILVSVYICRSLMLAASCGMNTKQPSSQHFGLGHFSASWSLPRLESDERHTNHGIHDQYGYCRVGSQSTKCL